MSKRLLVFAGTYEGHALAEYVNGKDFAHRCIFSVATDYGSEVISGLGNIEIREGRLSPEEMVSMIKDEKASLVVDATHPYATEVTDNIKRAAEEAGVSYVRLLREESLFSHPNVIRVQSMQEAAEFIENTEGRFLLTTGSKELKLLSCVSDKDKLVARVLPSVKSIELCLEAGISSKNILGMQGPFTSEMNLATLKQYGCGYLITKNTGKPGGFDDKISCADEGFKIVVIDRPKSETGFSLDEVKKKVDEYFEK